MSPQRSTLLALLGVLLAGIPLPALTAARQQPAEPPAEERPAVTRGTYATLQCSGHPLRVRLLHEGRELANLCPAEAADLPCELELNLPERNELLLEVEVRWPEGCPPQAATLSLEPDGLPTQQHTEWTEPGSDTLHALFPFSW